MTKNAVGKEEKIKDVKKASKRTIFYPPNGEIDTKFQEATRIVWKETNFQGILSRNEVLLFLLDEFLDRRGVKMGVENG